MNTTAIEPKSIKLCMVPRLIEARRAGKSGQQQELSESLIYRTLHAVNGSNHEQDAVPHLPATLPAALSIMPRKKAPPTREPIVRSPKISLADSSDPATCTAHAIAPIAQTVLSPVG